MPGYIGLAQGLRLARRGGGGAVDPPEMLLNGTFDTDVSGWTANAPSTITWNALGYANLARLSGPQTAAYTVPKASLVSGTTYVLKANVISKSHDVHYLIAGTFSPALSLGLNVWEYTAVATEATAIGFSLQGSVNAIATVDDLSLKKK